MSEVPVVTVISSCYNSGQRFIDTLESIKNQSYTSIEHIIIDDASTDNSQALIRTWVEKNNYKCKLVLREKNLGICRSINEALDLSGGKYISFIGDDIMMKDKIKDDVAFLEENEELGFCHSDVIASDIDTGRETVLRSKVSNNVFHDFISWNLLIYAPTVTYRKKAFDLVGKYDENLMFEDLDMLLRISYKMGGGYRPGVTVKYYISSKKGSKHNLAKITEQTFKILEKWSFLPNYKYYIGRRHLFLFYNLAGTNKKTALKYLPKAIRFLQDRLLYRAFARLLLRWNF